MLKGSRLPGLLGAQEKHFEILAEHDGKLVPIPFEVDERLPDGRFAMPHGPDPLADDSPGILDRDDEVVMMLSDLGGRVSDARKLPSRTFEIELKDPLSGSRHYAYIASVAAPRRSHTRYVTYQPVRGRVETDSYRIGFDNDFPNELALRNPKSQAAPNLIDGAGVKVSAKLLVWFNFRITRNDIHNRLLAWQAGPIRVIRRQAHYVRLLFGLKSPQVESEEFFYRDYGDDPFVAHVFWVPRVFFNHVKVRTWLDFTGLHGFHLSWDGMSGEPLPIGDTAAESAIESDDPPHTNWIVLKGQGRMILQTFRPSPDLDIIRPQLYYCADGDCPDEMPAGSGADQRRGIGYLMTGWQNLTVGTHRLDSLMIVLPERCSAEAILKQLASPPVVTVTPLSSP